MKKYSRKITKTDNDMTEFWAKFPNAKKDNLIKELIFKNGKIVNCETDNAEIIKWIKEKGLT